MDSSGHPAPQIITQDLVLFAVWDCAAEPTGTCTVTFMKDGNVYGDVITVNIGELCSECVSRNVPQNYTGWYLNDTTTMVDFSKLKIFEDTIVWCIKNEQTC